MGLDVSYFYTLWPYRTMSLPRTFFHYECARLARRPRSLLTRGLTSFAFLTEFRLPFAG